MSLNYKRDGAIDFDCTIPSFFCFEFFRKLLHLNAHLPGGAGDNFYGRFHGVGIQVRHLTLGNFFELLFSNSADFNFMGFTRTFFKFKCFFNELCRGRRF